MALSICAAIVLLAVARGAAAEPAVAEKSAIEFFEAKIRPVLVRHCYECHSTEAQAAEGELRLDSRQGLRKGGTRGPAIVPGQPDESLLLTAISHADPDLMMPPKKARLGSEVIADIRRWIEMGAPDPRDATEQPAPRTGIDLEAGRRFWAYQAPRAVSLPEVTSPEWIRQPWDRFILQRLEQAGLTPSPDAAPVTLLRRLHFDLVGLPPSPAALEQFQERADTVGFETAWETEVDALLASPQFGERWGRHWLDVARFAESSGKEANITFPYAWRYRDYVIDAFNADVPYDRFLIEQIAGDLLSWENVAERARLLIATGFLAIGPKNLDEANPLQFWADLVDEQIDTVTRAIIATSVACARCHDHKFDPYSMEDYYALAGIFASTNTHFGTFVSPANRLGGDPLRLPDVEGQAIFHASIPAQQVESLKADLASLKKEQADGMAAVMKAVAAGEDASEIFTLTDALRIFWRSGGIEGQLEKVDDTGRALPLTMGTVDREHISDAPLLARGEIGRPGDPVPRRVPLVLQPNGDPSHGLAMPADQSGRLELAQWLADPAHPLTARVMVNRIWRHLLGAGIVSSLDNFGSQGELPNHPELLDHLAIRFIDHHWSVKRMVKEIVMSRTYRQASDYREAAFQQDPDNRWLWRASKRRLEAEAIRDAMLAASGNLDTARPAGSLVAKVIGDRPVSLIGLDKRLPADLDGSLHRSVYLPVLRDRLPDVLDLFDFAEPSLVTGDRQTTNVPLQALYLMNSPFVRDRARGLADRMEREATEQEQQIQLAFRLCFSRYAEHDEIALAREFLEQGFATAGDDQAKRRQVINNYCQALLSTAEFRNLD